MLKDMSSRLKVADAEVVVVLSCSSVLWETAVYGRGLWFKVRRRATGIPLS
jgi:hypothetical protein